MLIHNIGMHNMKYAQNMTSEYAQYIGMQRLHSHFVHMSHLSHCDCVNKMFVINKC